MVDDSRSLDVEQFFFFDELRSLSRDHVSADLANGRSVAVCLRPSPDDSEPHCSPFFYL